MRKGKTYSFIKLLIVFHNVFDVFHIYIEICFQIKIELYYNG